MDKDSESDGSPDITKSWVMVDGVEDNRDDEFRTPDSTGADSRGIEDIPENQHDSDTDISIISENGNSYDTKSEEDEEFSQPVLLFQCDGTCDDSSEGTTSGNDEKNITSSLSDCTLSTPVKETIHQETVEENMILSLMDSSRSADDKQIIEAIVNESANEPVATERYVLPNFSGLNLPINATNIAIALAGILMGLFLTTYLNGQLVPDSNINTNVLNSHQGDRLIDLSNNKHYQENVDYENLRIIKQVVDTETEGVDFDITVSENPSQIEKQIETGNTKQTDGRQDVKKLDELRAKEEYLHEKEKFLIMKEHELVRKEIKIRKRRADVEICNHQRKKDDEKDRFKKEQAQQEFEVENDLNENQERDDSFEINDQQPRVENVNSPGHENSVIHTETDELTEETDGLILKRKIKKDKYKKHSDNAENREKFERDKKKKIHGRTDEFEQKSGKDKLEDEYRSKKYDKQERKKHKDHKNHQGKVTPRRDSSKEIMEEPTSKETSLPKDVKRPKSKKFEFKAQQTINNGNDKFVIKNGETSGKYNKMLNKHKNVYTARFQPNKKEKFPKRNVTGKWYQILHEGRDNIRKKEHTSDWLFERAHLRSILRDKAHWYFQWMNDRENRRLEN